MEKMQKEEEIKIPHVNLIIATPGHSVMAPYLKSLLAFTQELNISGISWAFTNEYSSLVADAREATLNGGPQNSITEQRPLQGQVTYDKILWIDSDIAWSPEDAMKLYNSDKDIITGAYLMAGGEVVVYREIFGKPLSYEEVLQMKDPEKVYAAGFGFICMKSGVFENLSRPWFQPVMGTRKDEEGKEFNFPIVGEDLSFCVRANDAGMEIWFDPTVRVIHHKTMKLTWEGPRP